MVVLEESYELRPKFTVAELKVILEGLEKAGFREMAGNPRYRLFRRISELSKGRNVRKGRIWSLDQVRKADELDRTCEEILARTQEES